MRIKTQFLAVCLVCSLSSALSPILPADETAALEKDRSPVDLVLSPGGQWLVTVNQTSDSVSLVRIRDGRVLDEQPVGERPAGIALCPDGSRILVTGSYSGDVMTFEVNGEKLRHLWKLNVNYEPLGVAASPDGKTAFVALSASGQVAVLDLKQRSVVDRIDVGRWPRYLCVTPDGKRLAVGVSGERGVAVVDVASRKVLQVDKFVGLNIGHLRSSADSTYAHFPWMVYRRNPITAGNIRLGWVLASRLAKIKLDGESRREAISLDPRGRAVADPHGVAMTPDEKYVVVSAAGTHELLVFLEETLPYQDYGSTDHIDRGLLADSDRFYRIEVGGRPMGLQIADDGRTAYVANYLENAVQVVDLKERRLTDSFFLGGSKQLSPERQGETIFYDARRSLDQWYSCHSCHYDGGTNSISMDTFNDGPRRFTFKTVLPLFHAEHTGPWTWHGWQQDLKEGVRKSLTSTMLGSQPTADDLEAVTAYLRSLKLPPNPHRNADGTLTKAAKRGKQVFAGETAGCANCHAGPYFTDGQVHDIGLSKPTDQYQGFNTPTLRGVYRKVDYLHDGRAKSLDQLLTGAHAPEKVTGAGPLSEQDRKDLIAYLKSL